MVVKQMTVPRDFALHLTHARFMQSHNDPRQ